MVRELHVGMRAGRHGHLAGVSRSRTVRCIRAGYLRPIDFVHHSTLGLSVITMKYSGMRGERIGDRVKDQSLEWKNGFHCHLSQHRFQFCFETFHSRLFFSTFVSVGTERQSRSKWFRLYGERDLCTPSLPRLRLSLGSYLLQGRGVRT